MESLGFNIWGIFPPFHSQTPRKRRNPRSKSDSSVEPTGGAAFRFPIKQAATAATLAVTGDTLAQLRERWVNNKSSSHPFKDDIQTLISDHNWLRSLRMASYGFLLYGPGSYAWYQYLEQVMPKQTVQNILIKVLLNQIVLGPCVIAVVFAWNNLWLGKLSELPNKYQKDALRTLLFGFRFWVPVSALNFWVVPLQARVAFMSMGSIFWNFWLSSTMIK
ncbi:hypothetical protein DCAR_0519319 [Daucus carota subsp. sativus]|uniref:Peroxisomal membrane protein n=1 Tax=Daucus carota subsp. sativus TaxID=79200 RepID=A0AAF0X477_DAUCS|nr:PREDICTED: protein Mpv17 [Daucus carota subsp. sativus]WOG99963.1 hypothetical protein DCAR_0519319 [Daucus carota subsp. sativus]